MSWLPRSAPAPKSPSSERSTTRCLNRWPTTSLAVVRESLTNSAKHARATRFVVTLSVGDEAVLEVIDDGVGIDLSTQGKGLGLTNLRNRAEKLGGTFEVQSGAGGGTRVTWSVPL